MTPSDLPKTCADCGEPLDHRLNAEHKQIGVACAPCGWAMNIEAEEGMSEKPTNPKDAIGSDKLPLHLWPMTATALGSMALLDGACKYGRSNFRAIGVRASIYYDAAMRHLSKWFEGEDVDPDSGVEHLGHVLACVAILVDAEACGKLNDDRMVRGGYLQYLEGLSALVPQIKEKYRDRNPKHYTIEDKV